MIITNNLFMKKRNYLLAGSKYCLILIIILLSKQLFAQNTEDVVYLKNGSIIRGKIIEHGDSNFIKIETDCNNIWVFKFEEIEKVEIGQKIEIYKKYDTKSKGFIHITQFGLTSTDIEFNGCYHMQNGYLFKPGISVSLGIGLENIKFVSVPVYLDISYVPLKSNNSPFFYLKGGYSFAIEKAPDYYYYSDDTKYIGGYLIEVGTGLKGYISDNAALVISFGYRYMKLKTELGETWYGGQRILIDIINRLYIGIGFQFQ